MTKASYRTGAAAKTLEISRHLVRRLIESGLIRAVRTPGGQYRIPLSEVERLKSEGIPVIPALPQQGESELSAAGSLGRAEQQVDATSSETEDCPDDQDLLPESTFQEEVEAIGWRPSQPERRAPRRDITGHRTVTESPQHAAEERQRKLWQQNTIAEALRRLPSDLPAELSCEVQQRVREVISEYGPETPQDLVDRALKSIIAKTIAPWVRTKESKRAIKDSVDLLPWPAKSILTPSKWQVRAEKQATDAIARLSDDASFGQKLSVAVSAVKTIIEEFKDSELKAEIVKSVWLVGSLEEQEKARHAVQTALAAVPPGSSRTALERVRDRAMEPIRADIEARKADMQSQQDAVRRQQKVDMSLWHISSYLSQLERQGDLEWDGPRYRDQFIEEIKPAIRENLMEKLKRADLTARQLEALIENLIEDKLDEEEDDDEDED